MATSKYYHNIDLTKNELINARLQPVTTTQRTNLGASLSTADEGILVFDITDNNLYAWDGTTWVSAVSAPETFVHDQTIPSATWTITHDLNKFPSVTVVDSSNSEVIGQIAYSSFNTLTITFSGAFSGKAYLN